LRRRPVEHSSGPLRRAYLRLQAIRVFHYERRVGQASRHIVAASQTDAAEMRRLFDVTRVTEIPTGVNLEYCRPTDQSAGRPAMLQPAVFRPSS
jgi:hypothetical protein